MKRFTRCIYHLFHALFGVFRQEKETGKVPQKPEEVRRREIPSSYLADYSEQFVSSIQALEEQWRAGAEELEEALHEPGYRDIVGEEILEVYKRLITSHHHSHEKFRSQLIEHFLAYPQSLFSDEKQYYPLTPKTRIRQEELRINGGYVSLDGQDVFLHNRQMIKAFTWKIGFIVQKPEIAELFRAELIRHARKYMASSLRGLQNLEAELRPEYLEKDYNFDTAGMHFEQLMVDVLNEKHYTTRKAPLHEDFLEKTDLRFKVPTLRRRKGARIQVTHTIHPDYHLDKVSHIRHANEFVILSPLSLAKGIIEKGEDLLEYIDYEEFWGCVGRVATVEELAARIRGLCFTAIEQMNHDPRGPAVLVPLPIRRLIQKYVEIEAHRATRELRQREGRRH